MNSISNDNIDEGIEKILKKGKIFRSYQFQNNVLNEEKSDLQYKEMSKSQNVFHDDFQIISSDDLSSYKNETEEDKKKNLLTDSIIVDSDKSQGNSIWSSFTSKISNFTNSIKYNIITTNSYCNFSNLSYVRIFDEIFADPFINEKMLNVALNRVYQMTYRSDFTPILLDGWAYTSDCGWGCMIRAAQMMLSKAILEIKIFKYKNENMDLNKLRLETLMLFVDNNLKISDIKDYKDFDYFLDNVNGFIEQGKQAGNSDTIDNNNRKYFNSTIDDFNTEITPPFSIQNICKMALFSKKRPGEWFSDVLMSNIFSELNTQFNAIENTHIFHFNDGTIDEKVILKECFEEVEQSMEEDEEEKEIYEEDDNEISEIDDKLYKFKKNGIILVSVRLGLEKIGNEYIDSITHIFKLPYNLGIIGGKRNSALYFIGESANKLIYLDPHINQKAIKDKKELFTFFNTYIPKYYYIIDTKNISPAFTIGFYFRNAKEYRYLVENLSIHTSLTNPVFKFKSTKIKSNLNKNINKNTIEESDESLDFCIINYEQNSEDSK